MAKREPLYPHVPKRRKKGTNAWRCKQCGWTTWNVIYCPKCNSRDLEELTTEEVMSFYETGKPVIHPRTEQEATSARLKELEAEALELQRKIRAKYPMIVPEPWPEELQRWQGRLWQLGYEIVREQERLKT